MSSSILTGTVRHRRKRPRQHAFTYDMWHVLLDVDELDRLDDEVTGFTYNRRGIASFRDGDHLGDAELPIRESATPSTPSAGSGATTPRATWRARVGGRSHAVAHAHRRSSTSARSCRSTGLDYRFVLRPPSPEQTAGERVAVHMDVSDDAGHLFDATIGQVRQPLTTRSLWRQLLRMPWVTVKTIVAILWEALFIWRRKADFHPRPEPPDTGLHAIDRPAHAVGDRRAS